MGGAGFIGRALVAALPAAGHEVVVALRGARRPREVDTIVFAQGSANDLEHTHVELTASFLDELMPARVIYLSSAEVYGPVLPPFDEAMEPHPQTPYGQAKRRAELAVETWLERAGAKGCIVRPGVVYGPGQEGPMLVPTLVRSLCAGEVVPLTPGQQTRDFIHVDDVVALVCRLLELEALPLHLNAGSGREVSVKEVGDYIAQLVSVHLGVAVEPLLQWGAKSYRPDGQRRYALSIQRALALGWCPSRSLEEGLTEVVCAAVR